MRRPSIPRYHPNRPTDFYGGVNTDCGYDAAGRLSSLTNNPATAACNNQWTFGFNPAGQIG